jgi:predicted DNA-binding ribbon-helix-helix protein
LKKERLSLRVEVERLEKLRRIAAARKKTMTQLIEDWIDQLREM